MAAKGGVFIPIYEREAMWINFTASMPFTVKIFAGGINAVSGEPRVENLATVMRRKVQLAQNQLIQDYVVPSYDSGHQLWLDGIARTDGKVMQFVATATGSGYSVEAQVSGADSIAGMQFEIMPMKEPTEARGYMAIFVKTITGESLQIIAESDMTIDQFKCLVQDKIEVPTNQQRLIYAGEQLEDGRTLEDYNIEKECTIYLMLCLRGGGFTPTKEPEMAVAAGGLIKQVIVQDRMPAGFWDQNNTILLNLQMLNASVFQSLLGIHAPPTPITPHTYKLCKLPLFKLYEEPSGIGAQFDNIKSVGNLDRSASILTPHDLEENLAFRTVALNRLDLKARFLTVSELEANLARINTANNF